MAYRQSLRDLQERLAQRLTAAKSEAVTASWLAVEVRKQRYLFPLVQSGEIFSWTPLQTVPYTKTWYAGVVSLRGGLLGVVDLGRLLDSTAHFPVQSERITQDSRLVSLHAALGVNAVLWIDRLQGLRNASMFQDVLSSPEGAPIFCTRCLVDHQGLSWQELDLQILAAQPEFLAIAA
ncbi:MAG: hypothetical protein RLZZ352_2582 [Pseudomonadota bacterium]|jgi:twitching motility protein PilI